MADPERRALELIDQYLRGRLSNEEAGELLKSIKDNPGFEHHLRSNLEIDFLLRELFVSEFITEEKAVRGRLLTNEKQKYSKSGARFTIRSSAAALLLLIAAGIIFFFYERNSAEGVPADELEPLAQIEELVDPVFEEGRVFKKNQWIGRETISLRSGLLRLYFINGAEIILEGPNSVSVSDSLNVFCRYGKISAHIPPDAKGFRVSTPLGNFIDQGTDFSLNVDSENADLNVIKGAVDIQLAEKPAVRLLEGKASQVTKKKEIVDVPLNKNYYISPVAFESKIEQSNQMKIESKILRREKLIARPDLLIYFDFTKNNLKLIKNDSKFGKDLCKNARIIGCRRVEGILDEFPVLGLASSNDRIRAKLLKKCPNITFTARIRIDLLNRNINNILFNNGSPGQRPAKDVFSWHINSRGMQQIWFGPASKIYSSNFIPVSKLTGTWYSVAVVFNRDKKTISFYFDGLPCGVRSWKEEDPVHLGQMTIGGMNWGTKIRSLNGAIEEFLVFDKALSKKEIAEICR